MSTIEGKKRNRTAGIYTVLGAIVVPMFIGVLGLGIDISHYWWAKGHLQNAADSAAFAGAKDLNGTAIGRARATTAASTYACRHKVDGKPVVAEEVIEKVTGNWNFSSKTFTSANINDAAANAVRVTVRRENVPTFFARFFGSARQSETLSATAVGVAGGARKVPCASPVALASCLLSYDSSGDLVCPTNLSFQSGPLSVGLTHPDGSKPVTGNNTDEYFTELLDDPDACPYAASAGDTIYMQNGNDLPRSTVDTINAATQDGLNPVSVVLPVVDMGQSCAGGATYNQSAKIVGFLRLKFVGARWTDDAPAAVAAACPALGKKNICVTSDCSLIDSPAGSAIQARAEKVYLVD